MANYDNQDTESKVGLNSYYHQVIDSTLHP
jgi:hypothetical protein